jgi:hypothetical protein
VVKRASDADLYGVALDRLFAALEFEQLCTRRGARPARGKTCAEDVRDLDQFNVTADRTGLAGATSEVLRGAQQLGVRIANVFVTDQSGGDLREQRVTYETELDHCPVGGTRAESLIH